MAQKHTTANLLLLTSLCVFQSKSMQDYTRCKKSSDIVFEAKLILQAAHGLNLHGGDKCAYAYSCLVNRIADPSAAVSYGAAIFSKEHITEGDGARYLSDGCDVEGTNGAGGRQGHQPSAHGAIVCNKKDIRQMDSRCNVRKNQTFREPHPLAFCGTKPGCVVVLPFLIFPPPPPPLTMNQIGRRALFVEQDGDLMTPFNVPPDIWRIWGLSEEPCGPRTCWQNERCWLTWLQARWEEKKLNAR